MVKRITLLMVVALLVTHGFSRDFQKDAFTYIKSHQKELKLTDKDISSLRVADQYTDDINYTHVFLQQTYFGIDVANMIIGVHLNSEGQVAYVSGEPVYGISEKLGQPNYQISEQKALEISGTDMNGKSFSGFIREAKNDHYGYNTYSPVAGLTNEPIKIKKSIYIDNQLKLHYTWEVYMETLSHENAWYYQIDAATGRIINKRDNVHHCNFDLKHKYNYYTSDANNMRYLNDGGSSSSNNIISSPTAESSTYNVFPFYTEAPSFGPRQLISNPYDLTASPYGWNDTNGADGAESTLTTGNNVDAYVDKDANNLSDPSMPRPDGTASLNFNFGLDLSERTDTNGNATQVSNYKSVVTQLYYMNNIMHDITYKYGFTETGKNFQKNNYGRGGTANDFVKAEAMDGSGRNNANFTPSNDGTPGKMQMYMFDRSARPIIYVNAPLSIKDTIADSVGGASFGPCSYNVTGACALANDGSANPTYACNTLTNPSAIAGKIAIVDRYNGSSGTACTFYEKAMFCQDAGAIGVVIINRVDSVIAGVTDQDPEAITIPVVFVPKSIGNRFKANIASLNLTLFRSTENCAPAFNGALDNGIVAHEYGHGISHRMTATGSATCLSNAEQGGEGWSDFYSLWMTQSTSDTKTSARGIGSYVGGETTTNYGIRRYQYSYDMSINPLTYGDVAASTEVHDMGEIACAALWDLNLILCERYGYNPDKYAGISGSGGNNKSMALFQKAFNLQPCSPGYIDFRNAMLKADSILYNKANTCEIWTAFARRGMGYSATQGSAALATDQTEAFNLPSFCNLTPTASFTLTDTIICQNSSITFTNTSTGSPDSVRWTINGGTPNTSTSATTVSSTFNTSGTYTVSLSIYKLGTTYGPYTKTITVKLKPTVTATTPNTTICSGNSATLTGGGATTYSWNTGATTTTISVSPTTTTTYTVTGTTNGCSNTATLTLNVNTTPTVTATPSASSICSGASVTITGGGATTYSWNTGATTNSISVSPTTTTTYTVTGTSNGCPNTATTTINVNTTPTVTATPSSSAICSGTSVTITGGGATTYSWNTGATGGTLSVSPTTTTTYTVTGTSNGCSSTASTTINVTARPTVTATPTSSSICSGNSVTINGGGATTYSWNTGATSSSISVSPTTTTTYTVTGTANGCTNTATTTINVNQTPTVNVNNPSICAGASTTLTATGATTYSWNTGATTASISVSPTTTTTYTVTGTANGCTRTVNATVTVNTTAPTVTLNSTTPSICQGESITLTANGADNYSWNTGATGSSITVTPTTTTTYTVNGTLSGCSTAGTATATVTVKPKPTVLANSTSICTGESATITGSGATTYSWNTGATTAGITVFPTTTTTYTVTGTTNGCSNTATSTVTVKPLPTVTVNNPTICAGSSVTLTAGGATTYSWNTGATTNTITVSPTTTTTYTVTGTTNGCTSAVNATVNVNSTTPTVTLNNNTVSVCNGTSVTLSASGADNYTWSTGASGNSITFTPTINGTVSVSGTLTGCSTPGTATASITVKPNPTVAIDNSSSPICAGSSATLGGTGADSYVWNTGATTNSISVSPTTTTTYSVTGTTNGCIGTASTTVVVNALPNTAIGASAASICSGQSSTLTGSGANSYTWNTGATTNSISVSPTTTTTYTLTGTSNGCSKTATQTVSVNATPAQATITQNTGRDTLYCSTVVAGATYNWYLNGSTTPIVTSTPWIKITQSGSYTVEVISSGCTSALSNAFAGIYTAIRVNSNTIRAWEVYPNPTDGRLLLNLSLVKQAEVNISIYNAVGSEVYVKSYGNVKDINDEVRLDDLAKGVYIIKMNVDNEIFYHKVVKN